MKKVVIIGKYSYIGESLKKWLESFRDKYNVEIISPLNYEWKGFDFIGVDVVINLAGIAHIKKTTSKMKDLFYSVNCDLSFEIANWVKNKGVSHFIIFSSMNVYGDYVNNLTDRNYEKPTSFYGDSKLQGDKRIRELEEEDFAVSYIRPPFVYGKGCKGNYHSISKIANKTIVFPYFENKKSMIYIDNLCEFVRLVIDERKCGILTPQNKELISTSRLVKEIAICHNKKIWFTSIFNWIIRPLSKKLKMFKKAFANDYYSIELSDYWDYKYCVVGFADSIKRTER